MVHTSNVLVLEIVKLAYGLTRREDSSFTQLFMYILYSLATSEQIALELLILDF